jgi:hypothetical protein
MAPGSESSRSEGVTPWYTKTRLKTAIVLVVVLCAALVGHGNVAAGPTRWAYDVNNQYYVHAGGELVTNRNGHAYRATSYTQPQTAIQGTPYSVAFNWMQINFNATNQSTGVFGEHVIESGHFKRGAETEMGVITYSPGNATFVECIRAGWRRYSVDQRTCVWFTSAFGIVENSSFVLEVGAIWHNNAWRTGIAFNDQLAAVLYADVGQAGGAFYVDTRAEHYASSGDLDLAELHARGGRFDSDFGPISTCGTTNCGILYYSQNFFTINSALAMYSPAGGRFGCLAEDPGGVGQLRQQQSHRGGSSQRTNNKSIGTCFGTYSPIGFAYMDSERWSPPSTPCPAGEIAQDGGCVLRQRLRADNIDYDARSPLTNVWFYAGGGGGGCGDTWFGCAGTIDPDVSFSPYGTQSRTAAGSVAWYSRMDRGDKWINVSPPRDSYAYYRLVVRHQNGRVDLGPYFLVNR